MRFKDVPQPSKSQPRAGRKNCPTSSLWLCYFALSIRFLRRCLFYNFSHQVLPCDSFFFQSFTSRVPVTLEIHPSRKQHRVYRRKVTRLSRYTHGIRTFTHPRQSSLSDSEPRSKPEGRITGLGTFQVT